MAARMWRSLSIAVALVSLGANFRSQNFFVNAPTLEVARQVAEAAEKHRDELGLAWLGQKMPPWPNPCPLSVHLTMEPPCGATSFQFGEGRVVSQKMEIRGPLDRLFASVLPHEIAHTVLAHHFGKPVPRWADEGAAVLCEKTTECNRHEKLASELLRSGRRSRSADFFT